MRDPIDLTILQAMSDEDVEAAALSDPDAQPLTEEALARALLGPHPRLVRTRLRLSQEEFAQRFQIPLDVLRGWEARKSDPDAVARAYMKAILADPEGVAKAVAPRPRAAE
jgi:putative transcriptional regulator